MFSRAGELGLAKKTKYFLARIPAANKIWKGINMTDEKKKGLLARFFGNKTRVAATVIVLVVAVIFFSGYKKAVDGFKEREDEYRSTIDQLETELDDRVAVFEEIDTKVDINVISNEVQSIGELASMEYLYTDAGQFSDPRQIFGMDIPFTTKSFVAKWDGVIKAGIDVTQIAVTVDESTKTITIHLPPAQILSHEIGDNIETLDQEDGLFNPITVDDVREFDNLAKQNMEERAIENGLLEKADENARAIIESLLNADSMIRDNYQVVFEPLG